VKPKGSSPLMGLNIGTQNGKDTPHPQSENSTASPSIRGNFNPLLNLFPRRVGWRSKITSIFCCLPCINPRRKLINKPLVKRLENIWGLTSPMGEGLSYSGTTKQSWGRTALIFSVPTSFNLKLRLQPSSHLTNK